MLQDLHSHTYYSFCGKDSPETIVEAAINGGIEITANLDYGNGRYVLPEGTDISYFDYCLIENPDRENSLINKDLFAFAERCGCPHIGVAHTDMFGFINWIGEDPYKYFCRMAERNIFWEMNVSYDSIHKYHEHEYVFRFFEDEEQQAIVRESGVRLSVGFDGHRVEDYLPERVKKYCEMVTKLGIKLEFED